MNVSSSDGNGRRAGDIRLSVNAAERGRSGQGARYAGDAKKRFALFAEGREGGSGAAAGFIVEEDRIEDGLHVAAHAVSVIVEFLDDAIEVPGTGLAGDEPLDEITAAERSDG